MSKRLFVNEEISTLLRKKGFNEPCLGKHTKWSRNDKETGLYPQSQNFFKGEGFNTCQNSHYPGGEEDGIIKIAAPLYQQVIDWFQDKHDINVYTVRRGYTEEAQWQWWANHAHSLKWFDDKYLALNEAIVETLKELPDVEIVDEEN
jgi:hypothetical protein